MDQYTTIRPSELPDMGYRVDFHDLENLAQLDLRMYVKSVVLLFLDNQSALRPAISGLDLVDLSLAITSNSAKSHLSTYLNSLNIPTEHTLGSHTHPRTTHTATHTRTYYHTH
jgi:hypothetical protein